MDEIRLVLLTIGAVVVSVKLFIDWRERVKTRKIMEGIRRRYG